jgi:hypothetical protein
VAVTRADATKPAVSESIPRQLTTPRGPILTVKAIPNRENGRMDRPAFPVS